MGLLIKIFNITKYQQGKFIMAEIRIYMTKTPTIFKGDNLGSFFNKLLFALIIYVCWFIWWVNDILHGALFNPIIDYFK